MDITVFHCRTCYADLPVKKQGEKLLKCPYCGCVNVFDYKDEFFSNSIDEIYRLIRDAEFENANEKLRDLLSKYPKEGELYFIKVLIDSRIVYVDDGEKKIPTYTNVYFDIDNTSYVEKSLQFAKYQDQKEFFEKQYAIIDEDKKAIIELINSNDSEKDFDVFISFKKTSLEDKTKDTKEAALAQKLFIHLVKEHKDLKIFYAPETLIPGENWERNIFNALYRSKCMIVIGSTQDNLNAPWVKNEWNRYLEMVKAGKKKSNSIIPITVDGDPYNILPSKLGMIQSLPNDINLIHKLDKMIESIFSAPSKREFTQIKPISFDQFATFQPGKVMTETHDHKIDANLSTIEKIAKTDINFAIKELESLDQGDQKVKETLFKFKYGSFLNKETCLKYANDETFFKDLENVIVISNVELIVSTLLDSLSKKTSKKIAPKHLVLFLLKYVSYLKDENKTSSLRKIFNVVSEYYQNNVLSSFDEASIAADDQLINACLGLKEFAEKDKNELLYYYCLYLLSLPEIVWIDNDEDNVWVENICYPIINKVLNHLDYLKDEELTIASKKFDLQLMDFSRDTFAPFCDNELSLRKMVYAKVLGIAVVSEKCKCHYIDNKVKMVAFEIELLNRVISECDESQTKTLAALYYYLMRAWCRSIMLSNSNDYSQVDSCYKDCLYRLADIESDIDNAKFLKEAHDTIINSLTTYNLDMARRNYFTEPFKEIKCENSYNSLRKYDPYASTIPDWFYGIMNKRWKNIQSENDKIGWYLDSLSEYRIIRNKEADDYVVQISASEKKPQYIDKLVSNLKEVGEDKTIIDFYRKKSKDIEKAGKKETAKGKSKAFFTNFFNAISPIAMIASIVLQFVFIFEPTFFSFLSLIFGSVQFVAWTASAFINRKGSKAEVSLKDYSNENTVLRTLNKIIRRLCPYISAFMVFYICMHFSSFNLATAIICLIEHSLVFLLAILIDVLWYLELDAAPFTSSCSDSPMPIYVLEQILGFGLLIVMVLPFLIRNFSLSDNITFYMEGIYNTEKIESFGFYFMTVFIVFAIYICQSLRLIAATDCDSLEGKSATIVLEILGGLLTTAMAISCIFMYFLPNPNIFGVIAFSILSFGGIPGTITLLIVTSIYVV